MDAGPDIDRRVDREIFGVTGAQPRRFYSVDDSAAQRVIERIQELVPGARVRFTVEDETFRCEWWAGRVLLGSATASRPALAACIASLQARRSGAERASGQFLRRSAPAWAPPAATHPSGGVSPR